MFIHSERLPHVLPPNLYSCSKQYDREINSIFLPAWHPAAVRRDLARHGDYVTFELLGKPIIVRNFDGEVRAFLNVCTHRHSLIRPELRGNCDQLQCQYHGWQFDKAGATRRIPDAQSFKPLQGGPERLQAVRIAFHGPLLFACLDPDAPELAEFLGPAADALSEFDPARWRLAETWGYDLPANWKIPVENTIESYHVPAVHSQTLGTFTPEEDTIHEIFDRAAVMRSAGRAPAIYRAVADRLFPILDPGCTYRFRLFHAFPHVIVIRMDAMLQVMTIVPTGPETSHLQCWMFTLRAARESLFSRYLTWLLGRIKVITTRRILAEDLRLFPSLQQGMKHSPFQGTISTREELIFAFQRFVSETCGLTETHRMRPAPGDENPGGLP